MVETIRNFIEYEDFRKLVFDLMDQVLFAGEVSKAVQSFTTQAWVIVVCMLLLLAGAGWYHLCIGRAFHKAYTVPRALAIPMVIVSALGTVLLGGGLILAATRSAADRCIDSMVANMEKPAKWRGFGINTSACFDAGLKAVQDTYGVTLDDIYVRDEVDGWSANMGVFSSREICKNGKRISSDEAWSTFYTAYSRKLIDDVKARNAYLSRQIDDTPEALTVFADKRSKEYWKEHPGKTMSTDQVLAPSMIRMVMERHRPVLHSVLANLTWSLILYGLAVILLTLPWPALLGYRYTHNRVIKRGLRA